MDTKIDIKRKPKYLNPYFGGVLILGVILYWYGFKKIGKLF